jgi:hypothetical protein
MRFSARATPDRNFCSAAALRKQRTAVLKPKPRGSKEMMLKRFRSTAGSLG